MRPTLMLKTWLVTMALAGVASATTSNTFVSAVTGNDNNANLNPPCPLSAPCRFVTAAEGQTSLGGIITILDSGEYDTVTLFQSVSLVAVPGVTADFSFASILVNGGASDVFLLKNLTWRGQGTSANGINFDGGALLTVEDCVVDGFGLNGFNANVGRGAGNVVLRNSVFRNNGQSGAFFSGSASIGQPHITIDHCRFDDNLYGVAADLGEVSVFSSSASRNGNFGFYARGCISSAPGNPVMTVFDSLMSSNLIGALSSPQSGSCFPIIAVFHSTIENSGSDGVQTTTAAGVYSSEIDTSNAFAMDAIGSGAICTDGKAAVQSTGSGDTHGSVGKCGTQSLYALFGW